MRNSNPRSRALLGAVLCLGLSALGCPESSPPEWTTGSELARTEFEEGLAAELKMYEIEAREHFEKALEADPDFVMAQVKILARTSHRDPRFAEVREHLAAADLDQVTPREAFLASFFLLQRSRQYEEAWQVLSAYLEKHPDDPYALELRCQGVWETGDWLVAEQCYEDLLTADPNWVLAQNRLGYLAMAQGHFDEAEERFRNYRYVAPDQANPHDSLGELFVLQGRHEEAEEELRRALEIRPDFCASYQNLATSALYQGHIEDAFEVADESEESGCSPGYREQLYCQIRAFQLYRSAEWEALSDEIDGACHRKKLIPTWLPHMAALHLGDIEGARALEEALHSKASGDLSMSYKSDLSADSFSLAGTRMMAEGRPDEAVEALRQADTLLDYWGLGPGMYKIYNRLLLVEALRRSGQAEEAEALLVDVRAVNPQMAEIYDQEGLKLPRSNPAAGRRL